MKKLAQLDKGNYNKLVSLLVLSQSMTKRNPTETEYKKGLDNLGIQDSPFLRQRLKRDITNFEIKKD